MSNVYYINVNLDNKLYRIGLDATTDVQEMYPSKLTNFILQNGVSGSDHMVKGNKRITFKGTLTDIKAITSVFYERRQGPPSAGGIQVDKVPVSKQSDGSTQLPEATSNKDLLELVRDRSLPVTVFTHNKQYADCYLTQLNFSQNKTNGVAGTSASYAVSLGFTQPKRGSRSKVVKVAEDALAYQANMRKQGNKEVPDEEKGGLIDSIIRANKIRNEARPGFSFGIF